MSLEFNFVVRAKLYQLSRKLNLNLYRLDDPRNIFRNLKIGYLGQDSLNNFEAVGVAYAKETRVFEKHVGFYAEVYKNNQYSCSHLKISNVVFKIF